jgi:membrane protein YdbS with pleckstrin-like domain
MKNDRDKAKMWPVEHWTLAKCVCVCVVLAGLVLTGVGVMRWGAAFAASLLGVVYVLLLTRHYTNR